jgi:hypothetical protein
MLYYMQAFNNIVNLKLKNLKSDILLRSVFTLSLVLYAGFAAPSLPKVVLVLFDNPFFRILFLSLVMWNINDDPSMSIILAMIFVMGMNTLAGKKLLERFELLDQTTNILPGCLNITLNDILLSFDKNTKRLKKAMVKAGVPYNLKVNDENAPHIATYLINHGYSLSDTCSLPSRSI